MSEERSIRIEDDKGNAYYPHGKAKTTFLSNGKNIEEQYEEIEKKLGDIKDLKTTNKGNLVSALNEVFTSADNGKKSIYDSIVGKKITPRSKDFKDLTEAIDNIKLGQGTACANEVLEGKTFTNSTGIEQTGAMKNKGNIVINTTVNDKGYGKGYFNDVKMKGLINESDSYIQNIIKDVVNKKGKGFNETTVKNLLPNVKDKLSEIIKQVDPNFSIKSHVSIKYKYTRHDEWYRNEIPFNKKININNCIVLITMKQGSNSNSTFLISLNEKAKKYNQYITDYINYGRDEWNGLLYGDPEIQMRVKQTSKNIKSLSFYIRERHESHTETYFEIKEDKIITAPLENTPKDFECVFWLDFDIFEI